MMPRLITGENYQQENSTVRQRQDFDLQQTATWIIFLQKNIFKAREAKKAFSERVGHDENPG